MPVIERGEQVLNLAVLDDFGQPRAPHQANDVLHGLGPLRRLDHQQQLERRRSQFDGFARAGILRAVDGVGPLDQFGQVGRLVAPALARDLWR